MRTFASSRAWQDYGSRSRPRRSRGELPRLLPRVPGGAPRSDLPAAPLCGERARPRRLGTAAARRDWRWPLAAPIAGYGLAWIGHFFLRAQLAGDVPAAVLQPRRRRVMFRDILAGRIESERRQVSEPIPGRSASRPTSARPRRPPRRERTAQSDGHQRPRRIDFDDRGHIGLEERSGFNILAIRHAATPRGRPRRRRGASRRARSSPPNQASAAISTTGIIPA